ncbi:MAG: TIGR00374 family protein [Actinobacteria bacterium]|nr:MAG: TIGR00374 family protein [Actinomycetota bacterium]REK33474.1 MAG: TIGR00374 family protein [Actinomycetota bacterium]
MATVIPPTRPLLRESRQFVTPRKVAWIAGIAAVLYVVAMVVVLNVAEIPPLSAWAAVLIVVAGVAQIGAKWFFGSLFRESVQQTGKDIEPFSAFKGALVGAGVARLIPAGGAITPVAMSWTVRDEIDSAAGPAIRAVLLNYAGLLILTGAAILVVRPSTQVASISLTVAAPFAIGVGLLLMFGSGRLGSLNKYLPQFLSKKLGPTMVNHMPGWRSQLYTWLRLVLEAAALGLVLVAFGIEIGPVETAAAFGFSSLVGGVPGTPGGLGVVEAGLVFILAAYGLSAGSTVAPVLIYRIVSYWLPAGLGFLAGGATFLESEEAAEASADAPADSGG